MSQGGVTRVRGGALGAQKMSLGCHQSEGGEPRKDYCIPGGAKSQGGVVSEHGLFAPGGAGPLEMGPENKVDAH